MSFEEIAGIVDITVMKDAAGSPVGATLVAPQRFVKGETVAAEEVRGSAGIYIVCKNGLLGNRYQHTVLDKVS